MNKDFIKERLSITELLKSYGNIPSKNIKNNWECSKHESSGKASLSVDSEQGICNCFNGCYSGDIYSVISSYENLDLKKDFKEILKKACEIGKFNYDEIPKEELKQIKERKRREEIIQKSHKIFFEETKRYFSEINEDVKKKRNLSKEDLTELNLGFLPSEKIREIKEKIKEKNPEVDEIYYYSKKEKKNKYLLDTYHLFLNRIIHPHYYQGRIIYLTGELIDKTQENKGKYVKLNTNFSVNNCAEGYLLDNLDGAKEYLVFAEGYWDALKLNLSKIPSISFGTCKVSSKFIDTYSNKLKKFEKIIICFDNENNISGIKGAKSLASNLIKKGVKNLFISELPKINEKKVDIDSFLNNSIQEERKEEIIEDILKPSKPYYELLLEELKNESLESKREKILIDIFELDKIYSAEALMRIENGCTKILKISKTDFRNIKKSILKGLKNEGLKEESMPLIFTSGLAKEEIIFEEILNEKDETLFCIYYPLLDLIKYEKNLEYKGTHYRPIKDEEIITKKILLPSKAEPYESIDKLDLEIKEFIMKWLDITEEMVDYYVLSIRQSWVYDAFHSLNYPRAIGEHATGKTRFLDTIGLLHYKPIPTSGASSSAVIFRICQKYHGTLIIDEADRKESDETDELIKIINQGYEKGKFVMRCGQNDLNDIEFFDPFCPKVLATRKEFQDKATESRCMTTVMRETTRKDIPRNLNKDFYSKLQELRNKLLYWRLKNFHKIEPDAGAKVDWGDLEPRLVQVNSSFISLFIKDKLKIKNFLKYLQNQQGLIVDQRAMSVQGQIVEAIKTIVENGNPLTASHIIEVAMLKDNKGYSWKPNKMGQEMRILGFKKPKISRNGTNVAKVYAYEEDFLQSLIKKFIPKDDNLIDPM
jgi:hypothetical protein